MNISVCITILNEPTKVVEKLVRSLKSQSLKPDEIIIIDAKDYGNCSRAQGRNIAVKKAKNEFIAMTDAGCIAGKNWLKKISKPLLSGEQVVAGYYDMTYKNSLQKAMRVFMGVTKEEFNDNFLPSTRSIAFTKSAWKKIGGFDEKLTGAAEDTMFNYQLIKKGFNISRVKDAIVEWGMPSTIFNFQLSIFNYARGDAKTKILFFPNKGLESHNIKAIFVIFRYFLAGLLLLYGFSLHMTHLLLVFLLVLYIFYSYKKAGLWGIILQFVSDVSVMGGFISGIIHI